ncbi:pyridoxal phosphate-dependent transferase [Biscogniauxia marginata]|nr:pyridoxal phosphate-dependent transferase [Biscogniauxia marginata]
MVHRAAVPGASSLEATLAARLADRKSRSQLRSLTSFPTSNADFSSNAYLSLSLVPEIRRAYLSYLEAHASLSSPSPPLLGSGGSRLLDGNSQFVQLLEREIAAFHSAPAGLLFNSGFDANVGLFSCLPQPGDIILYDEYIHASAHDGMKLSRASRKLPFKHNSVAIEPRNSGTSKGLDELLIEISDGETDGGVRDGKINVFVAIEGVYSMDGDVAPLREIIASVKHRLPLGNGYIIIDEAHSTGLFGKQGRGLVCEVGVEEDLFIRVHTFGKAMSSSGAIVLCSPTIRAYLINYARTLIYTTAMPLSCLANIKVAYDYLSSGQADALLHHLHNLVKHTHNLLAAVCFRHQTVPEILSVKYHPPRSPIIPVFTSDPLSLAQHCQERGFTIRPIVAPTVPRGKERVRVCVHAGNTFAEVKALSRIVEDWVRMKKAAQEALITLRQRERL